MSTDISELLGDFLYPIAKNFGSTGGDLDMFNKHVQFTADGNNFASSEATLLFSGPPVLRPASLNQTGSVTNNISSFERYLEPIGAAQQYSLQQGGTIIPFSELGSRLKRHARGTGMYSAQIAAVHTRHSDLKWRLYGWLYEYLRNHQAIKGQAQDAKLDLGFHPGAQTPGTGDTSALGTKADFFRQWVGLESELFNIPFGLLCITGTAGGKIVHIEYLEDCVIQGSGVGLTAGNPMVVPSISIQVNRPVAFIDSSGNTLLSGANLEALRNLKKPKPFQIQSNAS